MPAKPTLLFLSSSSEYPRILDKEYTICLANPTKTKSPFRQADTALAMCKRKNISIDGVVGFFDFSSIVAAIIAERLHLPGPSLKAIYAAQNKAIFTSLLQKASLPCPKTTIIDITKLQHTSFTYPVFIKPLKGAFSSFSYMIHNQSEMRERIASLQKVGNVVDHGVKVFFLAQDETIRNVDDLYLVQEFIDHKQYTVDAFVLNNNVSIIGITESIYTPDRKSFMRFDYPAKIKPSVVENLQNLLTKLTSALEFNNSGFNVEFFVSDTGKITIIEFNTRISKDFIPLFEENYVHSPFQMLADVALGKMPNLQMKAKQRFASSFPLRVKKNQKVLSVPNKKALQALQKKYDILRIYLPLNPGMLLSDLRQDAYSYRYGLVDIAGENLEDIQKKFDRLMNELPVVMQPVD